MQFALNRHRTSAIASLWFCLLFSAKLFATSPVTADSLVEVNRYLPSVDSWAFTIGLVQGPNPRHVYASGADGITLLHQNEDTGELTFLDNFSRTDRNYGEIIFTNNGEFGYAVESSSTSADQSLAILSRANNGELAFSDSIDLSDLIVDQLVSINSLHLSSDGKHLYASAFLRELDFSIVDKGVIYFSVDQNTGSLTFEDSYWSQDGFPSFSSMVVFALATDGKHAYVAETNASDTEQRRFTTLERDATDGSLSIKSSGGVVAIRSFLTASDRGVRSLVFVSETVGYASTQNGLNVLARDPETGEISQTKAILQLAFAGSTDVQYASSIVASPDGERVYTTVTGSFDGGWTGQVTEYMRSNDGSSLILSNAGQEVNSPTIEMGKVFVSADSRFVYARQSGDSSGLVVYERMPAERELSVANEWVQDSASLLLNNPSAALNVGNRDVYIGGTSNVALFQRDPITREIEFVETLADNSAFSGELVRHLQADSQGVFVYACMATGEVIALQRNPSSGSLTTVAGSKMPANCLTGLVVTDQRVYAMGRDPSLFQNAVLSSYARNVDGTLSLLEDITQGDVLPGGTVPTLRAGATFAPSPDGKQIYTSAFRAPLVAFDISTSSIDLLGVESANEDDFNLPIVSPDGRHIYELSTTPVAQIRATTRNLDGTLGRTGTGFSRIASPGALWSQVHFQGGFAGILMSEDGSRLHALGFRERGSTASLQTFARDPANGSLTQVRMLVQGFDGLEHMRLGTSLNANSAIAVSPAGDVVVAADLADAVVAFKLPPKPPEVFNVLNSVDLSARGLDLIDGVNGFIKSPDDASLYLAGFRGEVAPGDTIETQPILRFGINTSNGVASFTEVIRESGGKQGNIQEHSSMMLPPDGSELHILVGRGNPQLGYLDHYARNTATGGLSFSSSLSSADNDPDNIGLRLAREAVMSPDGKHIYVAASSEERSVLVYTRLQDGSLQFTQKIINTDLNGSTDPFFLDPRFIRFSPDGRFVYVFDQRRLHTFTRNTNSGILTYVESPTEAAGFPNVPIFTGATINQDGRHMYIGTSDGLMWFKRNTQTGSLDFQSTTGQGVVSPRQLHIINDGHRIMAIAQVDIAPGTPVEIANAVVLYTRDKRVGSVSFNTEDRLASGVNGAPGFFASLSFLQVSQEGEQGWLAARALDGTTAVASFALDTDKDLILDADDIDIDNDTLLNSYEESVGLNPYSALDATLDQDGDGLTAIQEAQFNTNPFNRDSDGDGVSDGDEIAAGTDPNLDPDTDGDGLLDRYERAVGLNPNFAGDADLDQDGDGLTAREEHDIGTDPFNADTDGDGISDGEEVLFGSNPLFNPGSLPAFIVPLLLD